MEFIVAEEGIPQNIGSQGALIAYYGSEIEFHYETVHRTVMRFFLPSCLC